MAAKTSTDIFTEQRQRVLETAGRLQHEFELGWIQINHLFSEVPNDDGELAETATQWQYRTADVRWSLADVAPASDEELERVCIHEYVHILLGAIEEFIPKKSDKQLEFAVESVARVLLALRK